VSNTGRTDVEIVAVRYEWRSASIVPFGPFVRHPIKWQTAQDLGLPITVKAGHQTRLEPGQGDVPAAFFQTALALKRARVHVQTASGRNPSAARFKDQSWA